MRATRQWSVMVHAGADRFPPGLPMAVQVEFTSRCNLRCRMCPLTTGTSSSSGDPGPMTDVVFDEVLAIARRCRRVVLAGYGEPLTNPQCIPMLQALDAEGIDVSMATNGLSLSPELARQLVQISHLTLINLSIDSPDPDVYREVRGGNVHRALQGLRNLMAVIDNRDRVLVSSVALHSNLHTLVEFPVLLAEIGVRRFSLQALHDYNDYSRRERLLDHRELADLLQRIEAECITYGIELELSVPERSRADLNNSTLARARYYGSGEWDERVTRQCHVPWDIPFVDKDGRVFPCCFAAADNASQLGRLGPQTFDEVWTGVEFRRFREAIVDGRTTPDICRRCTLVPLGPHAFKTWAATFVTGTVNIERDGDAWVAITVRNDSDLTWTPDDDVRVGTSAPRDSPSPLAHPAWLSGNRPATFVEPSVETGATATFVFPVAFAGPVSRRHASRRQAARRQAATAEFEIVVDGTCWLPNTRFGVRMGAKMLHQVQQPPVATA